jgi:lactate racemase
VLILVDDGTRGTPVARLLDFVFAEFAAVGLSDGQVEFLSANGTHRDMPDDEVRAKLGPYYGRCAFHHHRWLNAADLCSYGQTSDGTEVTANRLLREFDFVLGIGSIVPHRVKGTSGGAKIAFPGVSGPEMQYKNQWEASLRMSETVMGVAENSMRLRMEEAARIAGLRYIVNVVSDGAGHIVGCFCGDIVDAHRAGSRLAVEVYGAPLPGRADIVIIDSYPADRDFWQSAKGLYSGTIAVKPGGSLIVVAPNPEGVAENHPNMLAIGYRPHSELVRMVQRGEVEDLVGVAILADVAQIVERADCILVSPGVAQRDAERLGLRYAESAQRALVMARERQSTTASIAVIRHGGHVLPIVPSELAST